MGKISDALEKHKSEKAIKTETIPIGRPEKLEKRPAGSLFQNRGTVQKGLNPKLITISSPESYEAENFRILRARLLYPIEGERPRMIMVTSAFPGEGKTFVAANLAISIAQGVDENVLLIDCDLRRPNLHRMFGYFSPEGLHEYLTGRRQLGDLLIHTRIDKLSLLAAGSASPRSSELLSSSQMKEVLKEVRERYQNRFVIIDAPPTQFAAESGVLANQMDGIIFVVMAHRSPRKHVQRSIDTLRNEKILGIVFNGYERSHTHYHKYYKGYYK
jgi:exopolysaccharide/PEP-CTERM locus tyrosine autokinase